MITKALNRLYHLFLYTFATVILTAAVCVTIIRLALPNIGEYRLDIQTWITEYMGQPVEIKQIDASWHGWVPHLYLKDINILDDESVKSIVNFQSAHITIDLLASLKQKQLIPAHVATSGLDLTLIRRKDGSINIAKTQADMGEKEFASTALAVWLLKQQKISLSNSQISLLDLTRENSSPVLLSNVSLSLRSNAYRLQIEGNAQLPASLGEGINFALDAHGDILTPSWSGELYLEGLSIYPPTWFKGEKILNTRIDSAPGNIKLWSDWANAKVRNIEVQIDVKDVSLKSDEAQFDIAHLVTGFTVSRRVDGGLELILDIENLTTVNGTWPASTISISKYLSNEGDEYHYFSQMSYLKLDDISHFIKVFPELLSNITFLEKLNLHGELTDSLLIYNPSLPANEQFFIDTNVNLLGANTNSGDSIITGLSGHLRGNAERGKSSISSKSLEFDLPALFNNPITFYELNGGVQWYREGGNWIISSKYIGTHTKDFNTHMRGSIVLDSEISSSYADLVLSVSDTNIENVPNYLPLIIPEKTRSWIRKALVSGDLTSTDVILRGKFSDIPFNNGNGRLEVVANVQNATLDYHPEWVPVDGIDAEIKIDGSKLTVTASSGKIYDADIVEAVGIIADLGADNILIDIDGKVTGHTKDAKLLIENSPLAKNPSLNEIIQNDVDGYISLALGLDIPLYKDDLKVSGKLSLQDTLLRSSTMGIELDKINGTINFTENTISAFDIAANYFDQAMLLEIKSNNNKMPEIKLTGKTEKNFIIDQFTHYFPSLTSIASDLEKRINGACQWQAVLSYPDIINNKVDSRQLNISSSLDGLSLDLPAPLNKESGVVPFNLSTTISSSPQKSIEFNYGEIMSGRFEYDSVKLTKMVLNFSNQPESPVSREGITVAGKLDELDVPEWLRLIDFQETKPNDALLGTINLDIEVASLKFTNQLFSNVSLNLSRQQSDWVINMESSDINGVIKITTDTESRPLHIELDRLKLSGYSSSENEYQFDPRDIPPLHVKINDFQYDDIKMGELMLDSSVTNNGMSIDKFSFNKTDMDITGNGTWEIINEKNKSHFDIALHASNFDTMLNTFGYDVATIKNGETNLSIKNARWDGLPMDFSLATLSGSMNMEINKGQLLDVKPNVGRLFGLLSIQTLPRRLSLDFTDLFSKGLVFDQISGGFDIEAGNAYTNNLSMAGPSANIAITGRTGLAEQDYDQLVTVTPQFADSLPVASALFGPIGLGVGAVIFLAGEMFESIPDQIDKLLRYQYTITGSWDDPVVERYKRKSDANG